MSEMFWTKHLRASGGEHTNINLARTEREPYTITQAQKDASRTRRAEQRKRRK